MDSKVVRVLLEKKKASKRNRSCFVSYCVCETFGQNLFSTLRSAYMFPTSKERETTMKMVVSTNYFHILIVALHHSMENPREVRWGQSPPFPDRHKIL